MIAIIAGAATVASADPTPTRLTMKHSDGTNLHIANGEGAIHWNADITITVDLKADNKVAATSIGTTSEHNLYARSTPSYTTIEQTAWTTTWTGTWSTAKDTMVLDLALVDHKCKHTKTTSGDAPETLPCRTASKHTQLTCTSEQIEVADSATPAKPQQVSAWSCSSKGVDDLAESGSAGWLFGKTMCIQSWGGAHVGGRGFQKCQP